MYTPFYNKQGDQIFLDKLRFAHLNQLVEIDEGYKIEYKSTFDDNVKKKLPAIFASFANSEGGWLFIGIDDDGHEPKLIQKTRTDFNQIISQIIKSKVSPLPIFDTKFIKKTQNSKEGVLAIVIYEGQFVPYVSNGTIYVRNGSSKEPVRSERATIEFLYRKAENHQKELSEFCRRQIYFPCDTPLLLGEKTKPFPICNIYLKNVSCQSKKIMNIIYESNEIIERMNLENKNLFETAYSTFESIIFKHKKYPSPINDTTLTAEFFFDLSVKIHNPFGFSSISEYAMAEDKLIALGLTDVKNVKICDGVECIGGVYALLMAVFKLYEFYKIKSNEIALVFEIENSENAMLYFDNEDFVNDIKETGFKFCNRTGVKSKAVYLKDVNINKFDKLTNEIICQLLLPEFGIWSDKARQMVVDCMKNKHKSLL